MNRIVHVANTNVEFELSHFSLESLERSWSRHSLCLQLQFVPLLYAEPEDIVAVTALPCQDYLAILQQTGWWPNGLPFLVLLEEYLPFKGKKCLSWGPSLQVQAWAKARQMSYDLPNWEIAQLVNSKAFSFRYTTLSEAALLYNQKALMHWLHQTEGPKVLKTCFGLSGRGNWRIDDDSPSEKLLNFCRNEWQHKRPMIGEPWLNRLYDFSTQWRIHLNQQIEYLGATRFETDAQGVYQGTLAGPEAILFASFSSFLHQHRQHALKALTDMAAMGFFGFVGIDALLYFDSKNSSISLYPLVEINGRQTMSLIALRLQHHVCPEKILRLTLEHKEAALQTSFLPNQLINGKGRSLSFTRNL